MWSVLKFWSFHGGQHEPTLHRNPVKRSKCDNTAKIHGLLLEISSKQFPKIQPNLMQNTFGLRFRFSVRRWYIAKLKRWLLLQVINFNQAWHFWAKGGLFIYLFLDKWWSRNLFTGKIIKKYSTYNKSVAVKRTTWLTATTLC